MALFAACFGRASGRSTKRLARGGLSEAVNPLSDRNVLAPSPQHSTLPRLDSPGNQSELQGTCTSPNHFTKSMELRNSMIMATSPAIITVITYGQSVLHQNPQSKAYLGDWATSADNSDGGILDVIFVYEPEKCRRMLEELCREESSGLWKSGCGRGRLNGDGSGLTTMENGAWDRSQHAGCDTTSGEGRCGAAVVASAVLDRLGAPEAGDDVPTANAAETAAGAKTKVATSFATTAGLGRDSGSAGGAPADATATRAKSSWILTSNDLGNCERLSLSGADTAGNGPALASTGASVAVPSVAAAGSWQACTDMGIVPWSTEVAERTSRAEVGAASGCSASYNALQFPPSRHSAVTRSSLPAASAAFIGGTVTPAELTLTGTEHTDCTGRFSGSLLTVQDPLATSTFATFTNGQSSFNVATSKESPAASGRAAKRLVPPLPAPTVPSPGAGPGPAPSGGSATNRSGRPPPRRTISLNAPAFNRAQGVTPRFNASITAQGGMQSLHPAGSRALAFAMSLGTSPLVASVCLNSGGGGGGGDSSASSSPPVLAALSTCRAKTTGTATHGRSGAASTVPRIATGPNDAGAARVVVLLHRAPPNGDAGSPPVGYLPGAGTEPAVGRNIIWKRSLGLDCYASSGEVGGGASDGNNDGLHLDRGGGTSGNKFSGGDLGPHEAADTQAPCATLNHINLGAARIKQAVPAYGHEGSTAAHSKAQGNSAHNGIQPQPQWELNSKSRSSAKSQTKIGSNIGAGNGDKAPRVSMGGNGALTALSAAASTSVPMSDALMATSKPANNCRTVKDLSDNSCLPSSPSGKPTGESLFAALQARLAHAAPAKVPSLLPVCGEARVRGDSQRASVHHDGLKPTQQPATSPSLPPSPAPLPLPPPPQQQQQQQQQLQQLRPPGLKQQVHEKADGDHCQLQLHKEHQEGHQEPQRPLSGPECWHEVWATTAQDPITGADVIVLTQTDVTAKVIAERHLALVMETEHRLVEQLFPRHILQYITEEWTAAHHTEKGQVEAGAGGGGGAGGGAGGGGAGYVPGTDSSRGPGCSAGGSLRWRPVVRDCNALATWHPEVTLLFADIKGFTPMCKEVEPRQVMSLLNSLYSRYDAMLDKYGVYKVETIGDCYFVAGGLIHEDEDGMAAVRQGDSTEDPLHAEKIFMFAKAMLSAAREVVMPTTGQPVQIRIGLHTGPVVSGVVGTRMPRFCLFGDTVNTASRMESTGVPGAIHASEATYNRLSKSDQWETTGGIEVKGKGLMQTYIWQPRDPDNFQPSSIPSWWPDCGVSGDKEGGSGGGETCTAHPPLARAGNPAELRRRLNGSKDGPTAAGKIPLAPPMGG
ncbi:hypothetical protein Vafri_15251 [Volvox africanus]|uniref:Guanylate cyclase domain-containing protein n=1 Tax=Volvox africanus TaxID=51714 RepID=A0A8J4BHC5_9CHLO|nr:hypothetical protein Vafri_15251 [Volvox africanus]